MDELLRTAGEGQILRRGVRAAIVGRPNAGKSSLLNQLLGHDRAIVSPVAGTTRDTIEETANIRGLPVIFVDTAGLRESGDTIEQEGVRRSRESLAKAEFILHVLDAGEPLTAADENYLAEFAGKKRIVVLNKIDLPGKLDKQTLAQMVGTARYAVRGRRSAASRSVAVGATATAPETGALPSPSKAHTPSLVEVCCVSGQGIETLKDAIKQLVWSGRIDAGAWQVTINSRHQDALARARSAVQRAVETLRADATLELPALDLRIAVNAVGEIVGKTTTEDLLDSIFSQFCIGK
jgi:tRNA modification GTPase